MYRDQTTRLESGRSLVRIPGKTWKFLSSLVCSSYLSCFLIVGIVLHFLGAIWRNWIDFPVCIASYTRDDGSRGRYGNGIDTLKNGKKLVLLYVHYCLSQLHQFKANFITLLKNKVARPFIIERPSKKIILFKKRKFRSYK